VHPSLKGKISLRWTFSLDGTTTGVWMAVRVQLCRLRRAPLQAKSAQVTAGQGSLRWEL